MRNLLVLIASLCGGALAQPAATGQFLLRIEPTRTGFTLQNMTEDEGRLASQHFQYLMSLQKSGKLSLAAQVFDPKGLWGIVIVNAPDGESARALLNDDPMIKAKMFRGEVMPVRVVLEKPVEASKPAAMVDPKILESYSGTYKSDQMPLDIRAFVKDGKLFLQARGQPEFPLKAISDKQFEFEQAGVVLEFDSSSSFKLTQHGAVSRFKKTAVQ